MAGLGGGAEELAVARGEPVLAHLCAVVGGCVAAARTSHVTSHVTAFNTDGMQTNQGSDRMPQAQGPASAGDQHRGEQTGARAESERSSATPRLAGRR
jgi:hypothetical protein